MIQVLLPDHIPVNNYEFLVAGVALSLVAVDGLERELTTVDLPDGTVASGGKMKPFEFTAKHPKHHTVEDAFLEAWFTEAQLGVPTYKKPVTLVKHSLSGLQTRTYTLMGTFPFKPKSADLEWENDGEMDVTEWGFKGDRILVL